jgi:hypothetical protein
MKDTPLFSFSSSFFYLNFPLPLHPSLQMNPLAADLSYNVTGIYVVDVAQRNQ